ncbi:MAG: phosphotransferase [Planctomycetes bacterium]|nr:phosphotransferase [Planctomycetota bacterium]
MVNYSDDPAATDAAGVKFRDEQARQALAGHLDVLCGGQTDAPGGVVRVKANASRTVYTCTLDGQRYYLKRFHSRDLGHRLAARLRGDDAFRELDLSAHLRRRGVAAIDVLAAGRRGRTTWNLSRDAGSTSVDRWHDARFGDAAARGEVRRLLGRTARLIGAMHAAGVVHRDLHTGNILLDDGGRPVLADLHSAARRRRLPRLARAKNLAQLAYDRFHATTRTDRLRFLKAYLQAAGAAGTLRGWARLVGGLTESHARRLLADRDRRSGRTNRYFAALRLGDGWRGRVVLASKRRPPFSRAAAANFTAKDWRAVLARPEALLDGDGVQPVKVSRSVTLVRRRLAIGPHSVDVYIKRQAPRRAVKALAGLLRPSRAMQAFRLGHALLARRLPTALPLAALEQRRGRRLRASILITEAVDPGVTVRQYAGRLGAMPHRRRWAWAERLARLVRDLHNAGFSHRDLKDTNLLVAGTGPDEDLVLIDLDGLRRHRRVPWGRRLQGLMRINTATAPYAAVTRTDRLRALRTYLRGAAGAGTSCRPWWWNLQRRTARKLARRRRRQAPPAASSASADGSGTDQAASRSAWKSSATGEPSP